MAQEKLKTMFMQNFGVTNKEHYGMLWYFLEWSIVYAVRIGSLSFVKGCDQIIFYICYPFFSSVTVLNHFVL